MMPDAAKHPLAVAAAEDPSTESLNAMLEMFNANSAKLEDAYNGLQTELHRLNRELEQTNSQLERRIGEITEIKEYLNCVLDSVTNGVVAVDLDGCITAFNEGAERITGHKAATALGGKFEDVFGVPFGPDLRHDVAATATETRYITGELDDVQGRPVPVRENASLMHDVHGHVIGAVKVFEDLSEIRELEARARQRDRLSALGEMAATVAHEIRNPLGGIEGFAALLARDVPEEDPRRRLVDQVLVGTRSLNRVVTDLLLFTRPIQYHMQSVDVREMLETAWTFVQARADEQGIALACDFPSTPLQVRADAEQLRRAFLNVLLNAVQAMPDGGTIRVTAADRTLTDEDMGPYEAHLQSDWIEVQVHDSGPGIPPDALDKLFSPFFTTKEKGTGLGLAITLKIVEGHSGWLHAASDEHGTTFSIYLPRPRQRQEA